MEKFIIKVYQRETKNIPHFSGYYRSGDIIFLGNARRLLLTEQSEDATVFYDKSRAIENAKRLLKYRFVNEIEVWDFDTGKCYFRSSK